mmetsp:Transcript_3013/g.4147  ORF Transcript_3013/g.4147 Transcript_3013/m.4147 type:complete len:816 (-) Transcript_3013:88-2535(-)
MILSSKTVTSLLFLLTLSSPLGGFSPIVRRATSVTYTAANAPSCRVIGNCYYQGNKESTDGICIRPSSSSSSKLYLWKNFMNGSDDDDDNDNDDSASSKQSQSSGIFQKFNRSLMTKSGSKEEKVKDNDQTVASTTAKDKFMSVIEDNETLSKVYSSVANVVQVLMENMERIKLVLVSFTTGIVLTIGISVYTLFTTIGEESLDSPVQESAALMETILTDLNRGYVDEVDSRDLFETGVSAMLSSLDPYTEFENRKDAEAMQESITSRYGGIGLVIQEVRNGKKGSEIFAEDEAMIEDIDDDNDVSEISKSPTNGDDETSTNLRIRAVKAFEGYSFDAGLRTGDELISVDGEKVSTLGSIDMVRNKLRGEIGTVAQITVDRDGVGPLTFEVPRQIVKIPDIKLVKLMPDNIGYIQLSAFSTDTGLEMRNAILGLQTQILENGGDGELKGLILDLRGNPGGLLTSAVDVASLLVPRGSDIVSAKGRGFPGVLYRSKVEPLLNVGQGRTKLAVLVNSNTASAAEIVSGAIQDLDLGVIVGSERTFGKGLVQNVQELPFSTALKYTVAKYYTPSGRCIQSIDYKEGKNKSRFKAVEVKEKDKTEFYTKSGRLVKDGGGIEADLKIQAPRASALEITLLRSGIMKEYAADWSKSNQLNDNFSVTDSLYKDFQMFVNKKYQAGDLELTAIYKGPIKELQTSLKESKYQLSQTELKSLEKDIVKEMFRDFEKHSKDIKEDIGNAILDRYLPDSMLLSRSLKTDIQMNAAIKLLKDENKFNSLLARDTSHLKGDRFAASAKGETRAMTSNKSGSSAKVNVQW